MKTLRTIETEKKYAGFLKVGDSVRTCALCAKKSKKEFTSWRIVKNNFPYDLIAQDHDMLIPRRHVTEDTLTSEEKNELLIIKRDILVADYDWLIEPTSKHKSIPDHFHLHLIVGKES